MDRSNSALARRIGRPYRSATDTPLDVMLRRGALPPVRRPHEGVAIGVVLAALALALFTVEPLGKVIAFGLFLAALLWGRRGRRPGTLADLRARVEGYPIAVTGHVARWLDGGELWPGSFFLVFRERHPQAEATVRLAEPDAHLRWREPATLLVDLQWDRDGRDLPRLDRLVALLSVYRDELGLERIELGWTHRAGRPSLGEG